MFHRAGYSQEGEQKSTLVNVRYWHKAGISINSLMDPFGSPALPSRQPHCANRQAGKLHRIAMRFGPAD